MNPLLKPAIRYTKVLAWGVAAGAACAALLGLTVLMVAYQGFVVIGLPLWYAVTAVFCARYIAGNTHNLSWWTYLIAVLWGAMLGICAALAVATAVTITGLLGLFYASWFAFLFTAFGVTRHLLGRPV